MGRELSTTQSYHQIMARLGVQNPGDAGVEVPAQATAQFADYNHLTEPMENIFWTGGDNFIGVAGRRVGMEITAGGGGVRVHWVNVWSASAQGFDISAAPTIDANIGFPVLERSGNMTANATSVATSGTRVGALPLSSYKTRVSGDWIFFPPRGLYVPPGWNFFWGEDTQQTDCHFFIRYEEIFAPGTRSM